MDGCLNKMDQENITNDLSKWEFLKYEIILENYVKQQKRKSVFRKQQKRKSIFRKQAQIL